MTNSQLQEQRDELLSTLRGIRTYVEDGNVIELRECGFVTELYSMLDRYEEDQEEIDA